MTAFVDTMVLIWWVRQEAVDGQRAMLERAQWLMSRFEEDGANVMVSAISVAEFLRGSRPEQRTRQKAIIEETFICRPFDSHTADIAAGLFEKALTVEDYQDRKVVLKADLQIVATAIASKADVLYSHDEGIRKLAAACGLEARDLPLCPSTLFG